jgi:hypothetical protein
MLSGLKIEDARDQTRRDQARGDTTNALIKSAEGRVRFGAHPRKRVRGVSLRAMKRGALRLDMMMGTLDDLLGQHPSWSHRLNLRDARLETLGTHPTTFGRSGEKVG